RRLHDAGPLRRGLRRTRQRRLGGRSAQAGRVRLAREGPDGGVHGDRQRPQGPRLGRFHRPAAPDGARRRRPDRRGPGPVMGERSDREAGRAPGPAAGVEAVAGRSVTVRVPATSANLGPGFDSLGLALDLYDGVTATARDEGAGVTEEGDGEGRGAVAADERHLVASPMLRAFEALGVPAPGLRLACRNRIPHARGLGSSSAAIVAGVVLADALAGGGMRRTEKLELASAIEGHPDNVAPCLLGGFTIAYSTEDGARAVGLEPSPDRKS